MGLFSGHRPRGNSQEENKAPSDTEADDTSILFVPFPPPQPLWLLSMSFWGTDDDEYYRDENEGSIITSLISQLRYERCCEPFIDRHSFWMGFSSFLRVGMDLSRVTFPTFVLEPRSMLERITDFMSHPDLIFGCVSSKEKNPILHRLKRC
jgi:oxysterol-binding protein-related protein 8